MEPSIWTTIISWLAKTLGSLFIRQLLTKDKDLSARLFEATQKWAVEDVPGTFPKEDPSTLAQSISLQRRLPDGMPRGTSTPDWNALAKTLKERIPARWQWCSALLERVLLVHDIYGDDGVREFYKLENRAEAVLLFQKVADRLTEVCYTDKLFLGRNVDQILQHVESLVQQRQMPKEPIAQIADVARLCTRRAIFTQTDHERDKTGEAMFSSIKACRQSLQNLNYNIDPPTVRPLVMSIINRLEDIMGQEPDYKRYADGKAMKKIDAVCRKCDHYKLTILGILRRFEKISQQDFASCGPTTHR